MTPQLASDIFRGALWTSLESAGPILIAMTAVAVVFGVIQAATQVQDSSVTFTPKLAAALGVMWFGAAWMASAMGGFMHKALLAIPWIVAQ
jgi:flagellar biosynthesis protein FliQ